MGLRKNEQQDGRSGSRRLRRKIWGGEFFEGCRRKSPGHATKTVY